MAKSLSSTDIFHNRHIGPSESEIAEMLRALDLQSLDELISETVPGAIRLESPLKLDNALTESELLDRAGLIASRNRIFRSFIGMGYHATVTPVIWSLISCFSPFVNLTSALERNPIDGPASTKGWMFPEPNK
jgi:glycine cleavage system P protein (glycine dehydrogenase)